VYFVILRLSPIKDGPQYAKDMHHQLYFDLVGQRVLGMSKKYFKVVG